MVTKNDAINILGAQPLGESDSCGRQPTTRFIKSDLSRKPKIKKKPKFYYHKVTQKGDYFEVIETEKPVFYNFTSNKRGRNIIKIKDEEQMKKNRKRNAYRSKCKVIDLCMCNFTERDKFLTLTYDGNQDFDITNIMASNKRFSLFIRRASRIVPNFKYISVIEFQDKYKRGAVHYHLICNLPYMHWSKIKKLWSHGDINIKRPKNMKHVVFYIPKYFNKNAEDKRFFGKRTFKYSQNLKRPKKIVGSYAKALGDKLKKELQTVGKPQEFVSEYHGKTTKILYTRKLKHKIQYPAHNG